MSQLFIISLEIRKISIFASFHFRWSLSYFALLVPANIVGSHGNHRLCTPEIASISNRAGMQTGRQTFLTLTFSEIYHYRILRLPITNQTWSLLSVFFSDLGVGVGRGCWKWLSMVCLQRLSRVREQSWKKELALETPASRGDTHWSGHKNEPLVSVGCFSWVYSNVLSLTHTHTYMHKHTHTHTIIKRMTQGGWWSRTENGRIY